MNGEGLWLRTKICPVTPGDVRLEKSGGMNAFVQVLDSFLRARPVFFEEAGLILAHSSCDLVDGCINAAVHVLRLRRGINGNVIRTEQNNFCGMPLALDIENDTGLNNLGVVKVKSRHLSSSVFFQ